MTRQCPMCGPWDPQRGDVACPSCQMTPGEHAYRDQIMRLGGVEVYRREWRAAHGLPIGEEWGVG